MKKYNYAIYIGRFQGFHNGQLENIKHGLNIADKLIIIIGSANKPIDWKNPWTAQERIEMMKSSLSEDMLKNIHFQTIEDRLYQNAEWEALVYEAVDSILHDYSAFRLNAVREEQRAKIALVGCDKDDTTWYLRCFPDWKQEFTSAFIPENKDSPLNSTHIRELLFEEYAERESIKKYPGFALDGKGMDYLSTIKSLVPKGSFSFMQKWLESEAAAYVYAWYRNDKKYQEPYELLPYGTNFYCADNVVVHTGHVLLIKRKFHPGKDLWALPGGHINNNENAFQASIRELYEETNIKLPEKVVIGNFFGEKLFDHPDRSLRGRCGKKVGRTVSISHCYALNGGDGLPRVKPADDADEAWWFNLAQLRKMRNELFEDHGDQILYWLSKLDDKKQL